MATSSNVNARIARFLQTTERADEIVNGSDTTEVLTDGGLVPSFAKQLKDMETAFEGGVGGIFDTVVGGYANEAKAARDDSFEARDEAVATVPTHGATAPSDPIPGAQWTSDDGVRFEWMVIDGHGQWVELGSTISIGNATGASAEAAAIVATQAKVDAVAAAGVAVPAATTSTTQAGLAAAAKVAAELARDGAIAAGKLYASRAAAEADSGLAVGAGYVAPNNGLLQAYRKDSASASTAIGPPVASATVVAANSADLAPLKPAFVYAASKNLYNPALAEDGYVYDFTGGAKVIYLSGDPQAIISGKVPVQEGKTYTFSQASTERGFLPNVSAYSGSGGATYVGMAAASGGAPVVSGMNLMLGPLGAGQTSGGGRQSVTFLVPVGSGITHVGMSMLFTYLSHNTTVFDRVRNGVMLNEGSVALPWEAYGVGKATIKAENLPAAYVPVPDAAAQLAAFNVEAQRNLYNKNKPVGEGGPIDGNLIAYPNGVNTPYANGMALGRTRVEAGKNYVLWMGHSLGFHSARPLYCWDVNGVFLGIDHTIGATAGMANPPQNVVWADNRQVSFGIAAGSAIGFVATMAEYSVHTTADYQAVIDSIQLEENARTSYQPYSPGGRAVLKDTALPPVTPVTAAVAGLVSVTKSGTAYYVRGLAFDDTYDLLRLVQFNNGNNLTVNDTGARQALKSVTDNVSAWSGGTSLWSSGDSAAPMNFNGTYIGANHGANFVHPITMTSHGKVVQDVGSEWTDSGGVKWYIMKIVDANTLHVMSQNNSTYPAWSFSSTPPAGNTLTHSSGATNTGAITFTTGTVTQLWPCLKNQTAVAYLNGETAITSDGTFSCASLDIVNTYEVTNPASVLAYVRSQVGGASQPSYIASAVAVDVRRTITYRYAENGSCERIDGMQFLNSVTMGYLGGVQAEALNFSGKALWLYAPRVTPKVGTLKTWNLQAQEDISGTFELLTWAAANWTDADNPPNRVAQIVKSTGGVAEFGQCVGIVPTRSVGTPSVRKTLVNEAFFVSSGKKLYPKAVNIGPAPAGTYYEVVAFQTFWRAAANADATLFAWYRDGRDIIVMADFHSNVNLSPLKLPMHLTGRNVTTVEKSDSATVHGNGVVTAGGILVSVTGGYGYVVLRLS